MGYMAILREGEREREGGKEEGRDREREGGRIREREGGREGGRGREREREGGRERATLSVLEAVLLQLLSIKRHEVLDILIGRLTVLILILFIGKRTLGAT